MVLDGDVRARKGSRALSVELWQSSVDETPGSFPSRVCALATTGHAQTAPTQQSIEAKLKGPFLMLRGMHDGDKLAFDSQGNLIGTAQKTLFSLSAVLVTQIELSETQMQVRGRRAGLDFSDKAALAFRAPDIKSGVKIGAQPYGKKGDIEIDIARESEHPEALDAALEKVLSVGIDENLASTAPFYWQAALSHYLHPDQPIPQGPRPDSKSYFPGGGVSHPILRYAPDPHFSRAGRTEVSIIKLIVDSNGMPRNVQIARPLGMGLDEQAVAEVLQYRFTPAMYQGHAVPVEINIEVNFRRH
jgi:hypothetical protein